MSSPISSGDVGYVYQTPSQTEIDESDIEQIENPNILSQFSDTIQQVPIQDSLVVGQAQDAAAPVLALPDPAAVLASEQQVGAFMQQVASSAGSMMADIIAGLPQSLQVQLAVNKSNEGVQNLHSAINMQARLDAIINAVPDIPQAPPVDYSTLFQVRGPAALDGAVPANLLQAQQFINQTVSASRAAQIMGVEVAAAAPENVNIDSYNEFLAFIGAAIHNLQSYLDSVAQADLKGNMGQATDAGSDRLQVSEAKMEKAKEEAGGGILGFLTKILSLAGLMDLFNKLFKLPVPGLTEILKACADAFEGTPILGPFAKVMAENPGQALLLILILISFGPLIIATGPLGLILAGLNIATTMIVSQSLGGGSIAPILKDIPVLGKHLSPLAEKIDLENFLSGDIPLLSPAIKWAAKILAPIPIIGPIAEWGAEHQMAMLLLLLVCVVLIPAAILMLPTLLITLMFVLGDADKIPIIGGLFAQPGQKRTTREDRKQRNAVATANSIGPATHKIAKEAGASEETSGLISMIMKLIAMLMSLKSAAQGGTLGPISMAELMGVVNELTQMGIGGEAFKQAAALGEQGDMQGMFDQLNQGFAVDGITPANIADLVQNMVDNSVMGPETGAYEANLAQT